MLNTVNNVTLLGHLGRDPDIRTTQEGDTVAHLAIATSDSWKDRKTGEQKERVEWHNVVVWGQPAEFAARTFKKGTSVYVEGELRSRKWQATDGTDRYTTEVVVNGRGRLLAIGGLKEKESAEAGSRE